MIAGDQFGPDSWVRPQQLGTNATTPSVPQPIINPFDQDPSFGADSGVQTGKAHPQYEGAQAPTPWQKGNSAGVVSEQTAWERPHGSKFPMPVGKGTIGSLLMDGVGTWTEEK